MHGARGGGRRVRGAIAVGGKCGYRIACCDDRPRTAEISVYVGLVIEDAEPYDVIGNLCRRRTDANSCRQQP